mmetsp:Transcript_25266/g.34199  ORF Transcript_25266/g.34199 Transcript_25266/m.34199 type:complete len:225 (-) Transcript_25266:192-866(-)
MSDTESEYGQAAFFDGMEGLVAAYEFDYEKIFDFRWQVAQRSAWAQLFGSVCAVPYIYLFGQENLRDQIQCQHVCLTQDGIRYVQDKHKTACRLDCQDVGKVTKTVPYDKLTDCDIEEPAGAEGPICCMVNRVLYTVNVDTASSGGERGHELQIEGLRDPHSFKEMVWQMKRSGAGMAPSSAPGQQIMGDKGGGNVAGLLARNNELLEQNQQLLRQIVENTAHR